jgi:hypothetical protein
MVRRGIMAFSKYAKAKVMHPLFTQQGWDEIRQAAAAPTPSFELRKATQVVLGQYDPKQYLLTHCTIVASVDTESPGVVLGKSMVDGVQVNRLYPDFYITSGTTKYINNNHDAFERKLLLSAFRSFVGGQNYVEHVQIPELSKGRIIDAAARDIGDSVYVDILVATERRHKALVEAITTGQLGTLSMGCSVTHTVCSKCGNAADDETQLCRHIKYEKGNTFIDPKGQRRKVAELCGHVSAEPGSVKFIEASWVANPAFKGAVLRNILDPNKAEGVGAREKIQVAFQQPIQVADLSAIQKAARMSTEILSGDHLVYLHDGPSLGALKAPTANSTSHRAEQTKQERLVQVHAFDDGMSQSKGDDDKAPENKAPESPFKKVVDDLHKTLVDEVKDRVKKELSESEAGKTRSLLNENQSNESLIKSALQYSEWRARAAVVASNVSEVKHAKSVLAGLILHSIGGWEAVQNARRFTGAEVLVMDRLINRFMKKASKAGEARVYRTVIAVGGTGRYSNVNEYLTACSKVMGRTPTVSEKASLVEKGKLFSFGL